MLKKVGIALAIFLVIFSSSVCFATSTVELNKQDGEHIVQSETTTELLEIKETAKASLEDYVERYGSKTYGYVAYALAALRIYSIPFCFVGIIIGSVYQYVIGIRKMDVRDKGFTMIITFVTILLICQVLPLIFAIVVNGWRG